SDRARAITPGLRSYTVQRRRSRLRAHPSLPQAVLVPEQRRAAEWATRAEVVQRIAIRASSKRAVSHLSRGLDGGGEERVEVRARPVPFLIDDQPLMDGIRRAHAQLVRRGHCARGFGRHTVTT